MRRFFAENLTLDSKLAFIINDEFIHLKKVLRLKIGDEVALFNGKGLEFYGRIDSIEKDSAVVAIKEASESKAESPVDLILLQGLLKGDKNEFVIQKATELGVKEICFFSSSRTIPVINDSSSKIARWRKASIEAAKQCGRSVLPGVNLKTFKEAVESYSGSLKILFWENDRVGGLKTALIPNKKKIVALVGPEGGLDETEVNEAKKNGFIQASLGPRILKAETAALSVLSILQYELGDLN
ncbi:MAG: 16S rRNA (uracil(1498)-N(3))-methyltransferase [Deltaproteobacteria bacterium]|nr:16S rRNA (uracil(1498)-N(3))-methyltransferase [Deltaproteobacteria bacterium]